MKCSLGISTFLEEISSQHRVFSKESALRISWAKYWSFSFNISPSNEHSGLISLRMDWLDLLAVQGTLKSLQHHSSETSFLRHSAFFTVQFSHPYMTTGKTKALTRWTFVECRVPKNIKERQEIFLSDQCEEIEETKRMGKLEISSRKLETPREHFCKDGHNKGQKWYGPKRSRRY